VSGFVRQRANGRWQARFKPKRGKQASKDFRLMREAEEWLLEQELAERNGSLQKSKWVKVEDLYPTWHKLKSQTVSQKTVEGYESLWNSLVGPYWGTKSVCEINLADVREWNYSLASKHNLSSSRIKQAYQVLCMILDLAVEQELIPYNKGRKPAGSKNNSLIPRTKAPKTPHVIPPEAIWRVAEASGHHQLFILFLGMLGMRFSEAAALKPHDFDTEKHEVTIQRQLSYVRGGPIEIPPKGGKPRTIKLPEVIWPLVDSRLKSIHPEQYFCCTERNKVLRNQNMHRQVWKPLKERFGIDPAMTLHNLRHSAVTNLVEGRHWPTAVSGMSGHNSVHQTLTRYTHVTSKTVQETADKLDEIYGFIPCDKVVTTTLKRKISRSNVHKKSNVYIAREQAPVAQRGKSNGFLNLSTDDDES
jgi:integrase